MAITDWVYEISTQHRLPDGLLAFEYKVWANQSDKDARARPLYLNSHRAMIRATHQRIKREIDGRLWHVSGARVAPEEERTFITTDIRAYRWQSRAAGTWTDDRDRTLLGYKFNDYWGREEELDPQWEREQFTVPVQSQVDECIRRFMLRAERLAVSRFGRSLGPTWTADFRGTTLNLQVAASADDAFQSQSDNTDITIAQPLSDHPGEHIGSRFIGVTVPAGATIDSAFFSVQFWNSGVDEPIHKLQGEAADDALTFTEVGNPNNDIDGRTRTTAVVSWDSTDLGAGTGAFWEWGSAAGDPTGGADIKAIIQEITNRAGWASGNALVLIFEQHTSDASRDLGVVSYDGSTSAAAKLDIDYTAAVSVFVPRAIIF